MKSEIKNLIEAYKIKQNARHGGTVAAYQVVEDLENLLKLYEETRKECYQEGWNDCRKIIENVLGIEK